MLESRVIPSIGHLEMEKVAPLHIQRLLDDMINNGERLDEREGKISTSTDDHHYRMLKAIFTRAYELEIIPKNPMMGKKVQRPASTKKQAACYDDSQILLLMKTLENEFRPHFHFLGRGPWTPRLALSMV